jgi:hypothetical protein
MRNRFVQTLVLMCSLHLALPQSWCCWVIVAAGHATTVPTDTQTCHSCCQRTALPHPTEKPAEAPKSDCSCAVRDTALPPSSSVEKINQDFFVYMPVTSDASPTLTLAEQVVGSILPLPECSLHAFHCVWLC